ncbi:MAG: T9SS type A sorting domain-containing protein [Saprospiraceae bacterium]|nr:T9SS type A sorting domain-containing protein [Saprospiraceae bacterium]
MKNSILLLFLCVFSLKLFSQTWTTNTPPFGDTIGIADIHVVSENVIWAVGLRYGVDDTFYYFGAGNETYFALTTNGGATWKTGTVPMGPTPFIANLTATDAGAAMIIGLENFGNAKTLKTTNGGDTWEVSPCNWDPVVSWPDYIHAFSPAKYCAIGDPRDGEFEIYNTANAGQVWQKVPGANIPDPIAGEFGYNNFGAAVGNTIWFGTNQGRIFKSDNSGYNWTVSETPIGSNIGGLAFSDANHGVIVTGYGFNALAQMYRTNDGGLTWEPCASLPHQGNYLTFGTPAYIPGQPYLIQGLTPGGNLSGPYETWLSKDRGDTWQQISSGENIGWPTFINGTTGWAGDFQQLSHSTHLYKYTGSPLVGIMSPQNLHAKITLSPNPAKDVIHVRVRALSPDDFWVLLNDVQGKLVRKEVVSNATEFESTFQVNNLPAGSYTITVSNKKGSHTEKVVISTK